MRENKTCPNQGWQQMPTEELDRILQAELEKEHPNEEVVLPILHELEEREKDAPVEMIPEILNKLNTFSKQEISFDHSTRKRRWITGLAAAAAVICIVVMALPRTVGAESLFNVLYRWTSSVFEFFDPEQDATNPPVEMAFETDHPGLQQLHDEAVKIGITETVVPTWLPDGLELSELKNLLAHDGNKLYGRFNNENYIFSITYRMFTDSTAKFETEDSSFEVYDYANISHFILENENNISVTWTVDGVECLISTNIAKEDVYTVIKSIYRRAL